MAKSLGIFVNSDQHLDTLIKLCHAADRKGIEVRIFMTHLGTLLTQDPRFGELEGLAAVSLCNVSFESHGLKQPVKGIGQKDYATQLRNAEMIDACDRYLVL
jgi:hypothetical protein